MSECDNHWCEHYGKGNIQCEKCEKKRESFDNPDLRVILNRQAVEQIATDKPLDKGQKQIR